MPDFLLIPGVLLLSYLIGSIPSGLIIVKITTGKDIRTVESGRTGGTNAMRAAGFWAGLATALFDLLKASAAAWIAKAVFPLMVNPAYAWVHIFAPLFAILGHNYSIFLAGRTEDGRFRLRGGAGGAPCVGGSFGLWAPSIFFILPLGAFVLFGVGYASLATMSVALASTLIFAYRAWLGLSPWQYAVYGLVAEALLMWSLRPNIRRLLQGKERVIGWRARQH
ncbi:MAG: glycerol-3-phosphate acyltransferase [Chloroflexota bacterium]|nr:MAG: glycerol-3-phosphate acyltransferase [Chloroflexota bacterium]